jgi:hypothetical protein
VEEEGRLPQSSCPCHTSLNSSQERTLLQLHQERERAAVAASAAEKSAEAAQQKLHDLHEEQRRTEGQVQEAAASLDRLKLQCAQVHTGCSHMPGSV